MKLFTICCMTLLMTCLGACDDGAGVKAVEPAGGASTMPAEAAGSGLESARAPAEIETETETKAAANAAAKSCLVCHQGQLGLEGSDAEELAVKIHAILAGNSAHPAVNLEDTDEVALQALAEVLAGKR